MQPSAEDILRALAIAARLVELYGEEFLPAFEAMERQAANLQTRDDALSRAKAASAKLRAIGYISGHNSGHIAIVCGQTETA